MALNLLRGVINTLSYKEPKETIVGLREARIEVLNRLHDIPHHEEDHDEFGGNLIYLADAFLMASDQNVPWIVTREEVDLALKAVDEYVEPFLPGWFESGTPISMDQARRMAAASGVFLHAFMGPRLRQTVNRLESIAKESGCQGLGIGIGVDSEEREPNRLTLLVGLPRKVVVAGDAVAVVGQSVNVDLGDLSTMIYLEQIFPALPEMTEEDLSWFVGRTPALISTPLFGDDLQIQAYKIDEEEGILSTLPILSNSERIEGSLRNFFADLCSTENPSISGEGEGGKSSPSGESEMIVCPPPLEEVCCEEDPEA